MFNVIKKLVPRSWRNQFRRIVQDSSEANVHKARIGQLETQIHNLSQHVQNISQLSVSTTNNLEAVGNSVKGLDAKYEERIAKEEYNIQGIMNTTNYLTEEFIKLAHDNTKSQMCNLLYFQNMPNTYPISKTAQQLIEQFKKEFNVNFKFYEGISKNDIMFLTSLIHIGEYAKSYHSYLSTGLNGFNLIKRILVSAHGSDQVNGKILDFASGYGRVTRFLAGYYSPEKIHTSDIKPEAVDFQKEQMGVEGFYSSYNPSDIKINEKYGAIFVGSLFSHLNSDLYFKWLQKLLSITKDDGLLIFSVHDITLYPGETKEDHIYVLNNEDAPFGFVDDRITAMNEYGVSFSTENFVKKQLSTIHPDYKYVRFKKGFGGLQDVYVVTKTGALPKVELDLSVFP